MSLAATHPTQDRPESVAPDLIRTARTTGLLYLGFVIAGLVGILLIKGQLFVADDPQATLSNIVQQESLARLGIVMELGVVLAQALVALWFYRLFRSVDSFAAGALAAFGLVNAVAMLASVAATATALDVSTDTSLSVTGSAATNAQLMYVLSEHLWLVGGLFFGLWLIPMGWLVLRSGWMPRPLGWVLIVGGVGYILSAFTNYVIADAGTLVTAMAVPASIGEFWMVGYLILRGVRRPA